MYLVSIWNHIEINMRWSVRELGEWHSCLCRRLFPLRSKMRLILGVQDPQIPPKKVDCENFDP